MILRRIAQAWLRSFMNDRELARLGLLTIPFLRTSSILRTIIEFPPIITIRLFRILIGSLLLHLIKVNQTLIALLSMALSINYNTSLVLPRYLINPHDA